MADLAERSPRLDAYTVALLASLNIAQEFDRFRRSVDAELGKLDRDLATLGVLVESNLPAEAAE